MEPIDPAGQFAPLQGGGPTRYLEYFLIVGQPLQVDQPGPLDAIFGHLDQEILEIKVHQPKVLGRQQVKKNAEPVQKRGAARRGTLVQPIAQLGGRAAVHVADEIDHQARTARGRDKTVIARDERRQHGPEGAIRLPFPAVMGIGGTLGAEPRCHPLAQLARVGGVVVGDLDAAAGIFGVKITIAFPSTPDPLRAMEVKRWGRGAPNDIFNGAFHKF